MRNGAAPAKATADEKIESFHLLLSLLDEDALEPDVRDPVLPARVGASGDVKLERLVEPGQPFFQILGEADAEHLRRQAVFS